jgi:hypothetical protein
MLKVGYFIWGRLTANTTKANTSRKVYGFAALQRLVLAARGIALLQVSDGSSGCGNYECDDSEDILGKHLEIVLD